MFVALLYMRKLYVVYVPIPPVGSALKVMLWPASKDAGRTGDGVMETASEGFTFREFAARTNAPVLSLTITWASSSPSAFDVCGIVNVNAFEGRLFDGTVYCAITFPLIMFDTVYVYEYGSVPPATLAVRMRCP